MFALQSDGEYSVCILPGIWWQAWFSMERYRKAEKALCELEFECSPVQCLVKSYHQQIADEETTAHVISRKLYQPGEHTLKLTEGHALELIKINTKSLGKLPSKRLVGNSQK